MISIRVAHNGIVYVEGLGFTPTVTFLSLIRGSKVYWSSWQWLGSIITYLDDCGEEYELLGEDHYKASLKLQAKIELAIKEKSHLSERYFTDLFRFPLWKMQMTAASVLILGKRFYLGDPVGLGKTLSTFSAFAVLKQAGKVHTLLVLCTASINHQWKYEIANSLREEHLPDFQSVVVEGTGPSALKTFLSSPPIKIISYESFRGLYSKNPDLPTPDVVILDEAWKLLNRGSKTRKVVKKYIQDIPFIFAANASPIKNGYEDLYSVIDLLDNRVYLSWRNFEKNYVRYHPRVRFIKFYHHVSDLKKRSNKVTLRRSIQDLGTDLPSITATTYWIDLTKDQRQDYQKIQKEKKDDISVHVLARIACLYSKNTPPISSPKFKELFSFLTDVAPKEKVLVFCQSRSYLEGIQPELKKHRIQSALITGNVPTKDRVALQGAFSEGNLRVLLCTSAGEAGLNLQASSLVVNLDFPWTGESLVQRVGRVRPYMGDSSRVIRVINILARDTIEERVMEKVIQKMGYFTKIYDESEQLKLTGIFNQKVLKGLV